MQATAGERRGPRVPDEFDRIPKVELHCHVEGAVRPDTVVELARKAGRPLPVDDPRQLYRYDSLVGGRLPRPQVSTGRLDQGATSRSSMSHA
jgi:Adenosine deaminase